MLQLGEAFEGNGLLGADFLSQLFGRWDFLVIPTIVSLSNSKRN